MKFGIDRLLQEPVLRKSLKGRRVALLAHPASVADDLTHSQNDNGVRSCNQASTGYDVN